MFHEKFYVHRLFQINLFDQVLTFEMRNFYNNFPEHKLSKTKSSSSDETAVWLVSKIWIKALSRRLSSCKSIILPLNLNHIFGKNKKRRVLTKISVYYNTIKFTVFRI